MTDLNEVNARLLAAAQGARNGDQEEAQAEAASVLREPPTIERLLASALYDPEKSGLRISLELIDAPRRNDKRSARMTFAVPDEWCLNATGETNLAGLYLLCKLDREFLNAMAGVDPE